MWSLGNKKKKLVDSGVLTGLTDTHSHLLFGVDDGARSSNHTISIISRLKKLGVRRSFVTPHVMANLVANSSRNLSSNFESKLSPIIAELDFDLRLAGEYMLDEAFLGKLKDEDRMLTYDGKHLLVEMSHIAPPVRFQEMLFEIESCGYVPVVAHPERYCHYFSMSDYEKLKLRGCRFQMNILSFTDVYGSSVMKMQKELMKLEMYDFIGSDAHSTRGVEFISSIKVEQEQLDKIAVLVKNNEMLWME